MKAKKRSTGKPPKQMARDESTYSSGFPAGSNRQRLPRERLLVRRWMSLRRWRGLGAGVCCWLNVWGAERYARLGQARRAHRWRWPTEVTYWFAGMALHIARLLHPKPIFDFTGG